MRYRAILGTALATVIGLSACEDVPTACAGVSIPGLVVTVIDAVTQQPLTADATGVVRGLDYVEMLVHHGTALTGLYDRSGLYRVAITVPGYQPWDSANVYLREPEGCEAFTTELIVGLTPED